MTDAMELTQTAEDYVKVVWNATEWSDEPVTTKRLAERLGVGAPTVSDQVRKLCDQGLLSHARYGAIELTAEGQRHAVAMARKHRIIETFLVTELGYGWDQVHDEAEVLEHACSPRMIEAMADRLGDPERDPHGDPIPRRDGTVPRPHATALPEASPGKWRVARVSDADPDALRRLAHAGIALDATVTVTAVPGGGLEFVAAASVSGEDAAAVWVVPAGDASA